MINAKIVLTGNFNVGKTSLFKRFIFNEFAIDYQATIGVRVEKKEITHQDEIINLLLWDVAGLQTQVLSPDSYFVGAAVIILVIDLSNPITFQNIIEDINHIKKVEPRAFVKIVGNKKDLLSQESLDKILQDFPIPFSKTTSAKTGENVNSFFEEIAEEIFISVTK